MQVCLVRLDLHNMVPEEWYRYSQYRRPLSMAGRTTIPDDLVEIESRNQEGNTFLILKSLHHSVAAQVAKTIPKLKVAVTNLV